MDTISKINGDFGIWQLRTILIIFLCKIPSSWFMACVIFTAPTTRPNEFICKYNSNINQNNNQCYYINNQSIQMPCTEFVYNANYYSAVMQFNLVCDRDIFVAWTQYWHLFGVLCGGIIATKLMLFVRPRRVMLMGIILQLICGCLTGLIDNFNSHCLFRCLSAICCALMFTSGQTIFTEITGGIYKIATITIYDTFWSIGVILLPTLSSFFTNWQYLYLGITLPTSILLILYYWIPEAPYWLLKNNQLHEIQQILINSAQINDRQYLLSNNLLEQLENDAKNLQNNLKQSESNNSNNNNNNWFSLWKLNNKQIILNIICAHLALAIYITNFNGMLLNIRSFHREYLPINTVLTAISELVGCFFALHIILKHNHNKWQIAGVYNIIAGVIGCFGWFIPNNLDDNLRVSCWMLISSIAKAGVSISQSMLLACIPELVNHSNQKSILIFSCVVWARIWLLTAPFINVLRKIDTAMSLSCFSILSLIGGIATCCLQTPTTSANITKNINSEIAVTNATATATAPAATVNNSINERILEPKQGIYNIANDIQL